MSMLATTCRSVFLATFVIVPTTTYAQFAAVLAPPVDHPVSIPSSTLTPHTWKNASGAWGETLVNQIYKLRGFDEVFEIKRPGGQGIDHLALKYDASGKLLDVRFGETKTHFGGTAKPSNTKLGPQLSRRWLADKLRTLRNSGDPHLRNLALKIARFRKEHGVPIKSFGEFHDLNTKTGRYIRRNPVSGAQLSNYSIERILKSVQQRGSTQAQPWAARSLSQWDQITSTSMKSSIARKSTARTALLQRSSKAVPALAMRTTVSQSLRQVARAAGPIGAAVAVAFDSYEMYSHVAAYRRGDMNRRDMAIAVSRSGGGIVGAGTGAATGAWLGTFGGPAAWITVPVGATIGGIVGYFVGSTTTGAIAHAYYSKIDDDVKKEVDQWIIATSYVQLTVAQ